MQTNQTVLLVAGRRSLRYKPHYVLPVAQLATTLLHGSALQAVYPTLPQATRVALADHYARLAAAGNVAAALALVYCW